MPDFFAAWVHVKATENSPEALLAALKAGDFHSSQGPKIHHLEITETEIHIKFSAAKGVLVNGQGYQHVEKFEPGLTSATLCKKKLSATPWCRIIVTGEDGKRAWTNQILGETN